MTPASTISSSTSADFTAVGQKVFRDRLRSALDEIASGIPESDNFWSRFGSQPVRNEGTHTLVLADLASLVRHFKNWDVHGWTASVRRAQPFFVAFVRTQRDRECAAMVDDLLKASDMRLNVCNDSSDWDTVFRCLNAGMSGTRRDGLLEVRYLPSLDSFWTHFGDGFAGLLTWADLGLEETKHSLIPESATVSPTNTAIELATRDDDLYEIDSAVARAVLDEAFAEELRRSASDYDEALGARVKRAREAAGLTQPKLGKLAGLDQAVISRIERGRVRPRIDTLRRLASGLTLSVSELLSA